MDKCKKHSLRFAAGRCKRCHIPICDECKIQVSEGIFCSDECVQQFRDFQGRMSSFSGRSSRFSLLGFLRNTAISAVLLVVIYVVLYFWLGTGDPKEMAGKLWAQIRLMF